ncbi:MAG: hypothetical protein ABIW80_08160, partial [Lapillicoccus sp.]
MSPDLSSQGEGTTGRRAQAMRKLIRSIDQLKPLSTGVLMTRGRPSRATVYARLEAAIADVRDRL